MRPPIEAVLELAIATARVARVARIAAEDQVAAASVEATMQVEDQVAAASVEATMQVEDQVAAVAIFWRKHALLDVEPSSYLAHPCPFLALPVASSPPPPHQDQANFGVSQQLRRVFVAADPLGRSSSAVSSTAI